MSKSIAPAGGMATRAPKGISPTPAPMPAAIPVPPLIRNGNLIWCPAIKLRMDREEIHEGWSVKVNGSVTASPLHRSRKNTVIPAIGLIS